LAYYTEWGSEIHLTGFGKRLDDDQIRIEHFGITISDKDKLQFYLEQMYASNHFDKKEMTEWENKSIAIKDDFDEAKLNFEGLQSLCAKQQWHRQQVQLRKHESSNRS